MSEQYRYEKEEKEEKELEKQGEKEEKESQEKNWEEKWRRDPLGAAVWAAILIWAGLALLLGNLGLLASFDPLEAWDFIFIGAGVILLLEVLVRLVVPSYRRPVTGSIILAVVLLAIGMGDLLTWPVIWAVALIVIGVVMLLRTFLRRR